MATYVQTNQPITLTNANYVVSVVDTGKIFLLIDITGDRTITLPAPVAGLHYIFINLALAAVHNWTVECGAGTVNGVLVRVGVAVATAVAAGGHINFIGGTSIVGDCVEVYCNGLTWSVGLSVEPEQV